MARIIPDGWRELAPCTESIAGRAALAFAKKAGMPQLTLIVADSDGNIDGEALHSGLDTAFGCDLRQGQIGAHAGTTFSLDATSAAETPATASAIRSTSASESRAAPWGSMPTSR